MVICKYLNRKIQHRMENSRWFLKHLTENTIKSLNYYPPNKVFVNLFV